MKKPTIKAPPNRGPEKAWGPQWGWTDLAGLMVLLGLTVYGLLRIRLGLDLTDEGFYLSAPLRFALGDVPFRDDISNPVRLFDLFLWPVYSTFPKITVWQLRLIGLGIHLAAVTSVTVLLRRYAPAYLIALIAGSAAFAYEWIWTPNYNLMGADFLTIGLCLWIAGCRSPRSFRNTGLAAAAGLCLFIGIMSYFPFFAVLIVPLFAFIPGPARNNLRSPSFRTTVETLGTAAFLFLSAAALLFYAGLFEDWLNAAKFAFSTQGSGRPFTERIPAYLSHLWVSLPNTLLVAAIILISHRLILWKQESQSWRGVWGGTILLTSAAVGLLIAYYPPPIYRWEQYPAPHFIFFAVLAFHLVSLWWLRSLFGAKNILNYEWKSVWALLLPAGLLLTVIHSLSSTNGFVNSFYSMTLFAALGVTALFQAAINKSKARIGGFQTKRTAFWLAAILAPYTALALVAGYNDVYCDASPARLNAKFQNFRLEKLRSTPGRVDPLEETLDFLTKRLIPGETFLAYYEIPIFYYLTWTRPALNHTWTNLWWTAEQMQDNIDIMIEKGRMPRYSLRCVVHPWGLGEPEIPKTIPYSINPELDPVHAFVRANYRPVALFYPFQVWERRDLAVAATGKPLQPVSITIDSRQWVQGDQSDSSPLTEISGDISRFSWSSQEGELTVTLNETARQEMAGPAANKPVPVFLLSAELDREMAAGKTVLLSVPLRFEGTGACSLYLDDYVGQSRARHEVKAIPGQQVAASLDTVVRPNATAVKVGVEFRPESSQDLVKIGEFKIQIE